jgi:hypothetical protein
MVGVGVSGKRIGRHTHRPSTVTWEQPPAMGGAAAFHLSPLSDPYWPPKQTNQEANGDKITERLT